MEMSNVYFALFLSKSNPSFREISVDVCDSFFLRLLCLFCDSREVGMKILLNFAQS